jgi:hypothetical protein
MTHDAYECSIPNKLSSEPEKRFLEIVVGFGRNIVILKILLPVKCDGLRFDLALLDVDLVTAQNNWNILANSNEVTYSIYKLLRPRIVPGA